MNRRVIHMLLAILTLAAIGGFGRWFTSHQVNRKDREIRSQMLDQAVRMADAINPELVRNLTFTEEDSRNPAYHRIRLQMIAYGQIVYQRGIYSMALRDGQLLFGPENYPEDDPMGAGLPGTVYEEPSPEDFLVFETGRPMVMGPITDEYGEFISTLAPVTDPVSGEVLMVVGIDVLSSSWRQELNQARMFPLLITFLLLVLSIAGIFYYWLRMKRKTWFRLRGSLMEGMLILTFGLLVTLILSWVVHEYEVHERAFVFRQQADLHARQVYTIRTGFSNDFNILRSFFESSEQVTQEEFVAFTRHLSGTRGIRCYTLARVSPGQMEILYHNRGIPEWWFSESGLPDSAFVRPILRSVREGLPQAITIQAEQNRDTSGPTILLTFPMTRVPVSLSEGDSFPTSAFVFLVQISLQEITKGLESGTGFEIPLIRSGLWDLPVDGAPRFMVGTDIESETCGLPAFSRGEDFSYHPFTHISPVFINGLTFAMASCPQPVFYREYPIFATWLSVLAGVFLFGGLALFIGLLRNRQAILERAVDQRTAELQERLADLAQARDKAEAGDRLKTAFIRNISHEIRTPLNGILGFSNLIASPDLTVEERTNYAGLIRSSSDRLLATITDYMDISRIESGTMETYPAVFPVEEVTRQVYARYHQPFLTRGINLVRQEPQQGSALRILTDRDLLIKVFSHLLDNALKFTKQGIVTLGYSVTNQTIRFFVLDTGIGMSPEAMNKSAEPFFQEEISDTRGYEGSGLGLSIVRGVIRLLGGTMEVQSKKGEGTSVWFTLPAYPGEEEFPLSQQRPAATPAKPGMILIVEDDLSNLQYIEALLKSTGISLLTATNGKQAVGLCHEHPGIALVLMDIKMPVMDGLEATRLIKQQRPELPVIALTAYALTGDAEIAMQAGCDDYLSKPFGKAALMSKVNRFLVSGEHTG